MRAPKEQGYTYRESDVYRCRQHLDLLCVLFSVSPVCSAQHARSGCATGSLPPGALGVQQHANLQQGSRSGAPVQMPRPHLAALQPPSGRRLPLIVSINSMSESLCLRAAAAAVRMGMWPISIGISCPQACGLRIMITLLARTRVSSPAALQVYPAQSVTHHLVLVCRRREVLVLKRPEHVAPEAVLKSRLHQALCPCQAKPVDKQALAFPGHPTLGAMPIVRPQYRCVLQGCCMSTVCRRRSGSWWLCIRQPPGSQAFPL